MIVPILQIKKLAREVERQSRRAAPGSLALELLCVGPGTERDGAGGGNLRWQRWKCPLRRKSGCQLKPEPQPGLME